MNEPLVLTPKKLTFTDLVDLVRVILCWITGYWALGTSLQTLARFSKWSQLGFVPYKYNGLDPQLWSSTSNLSLFAAITLGLSWLFCRDKLKWPLILAAVATIQTVTHGVLFLGGGIDLQCAPFEYCYAY